MPRNAIWLRRGVGSALLPADRRAEDAIRALPDREEVRCEVRADRHGKYHRLYFNMLHHVVEALNNGPAETNEDELRDWIKIKLGHVELKELPPALARAADQSHVLMLKSWSWAKMDQRQFEGVFLESVRLFLSEWPWLRSSPQWPEIEDHIRRAGLEEAA